MWQFLIKTKGDSSLKSIKGKPNPLTIAQKVSVNMTLKYFSSHK